ncbi:MAG: molybdenum cofactor guanylyltransferase MobA [Rhodothermia bacterium]|nr:MAG: molybdenum cofactor guanylyltransferase MobA [Rhodothermia bacterium]
MNDRRESKISLGLLVGGQSARFGSEKYRAELNGVPLIEHVYRAARGLVDEVLLSVGSGEKEIDLPHDRIVVDTLPGAGPLAGIHACMSEASNDWLLILACDLPFVTGETLTRLIQKAKEPNRIVMCRSRDGQTQPLCCCYHCSLMPLLESAIREERFGVHQFVDSVSNVVELEVPSEELRNINHPDDLAPTD